ncbi:MAG TPA: FHA domain-containing protein [Planctomycetota bacterium]|nr:FHA domain-containing protein [Planctomycetota bacterium]HQA99595.1 FHA domain-containing protein [Planctomycetota bacterium]
MENLYLLDDTTGKIYPLYPDKDNMIGRGVEEKDGWISLPDITVSKMHAKISMKDQQLVIENFSTKNPITVNGNAITTPVILENNDKIVIGKNTFTFYENFISAETMEMPKFVDKPAPKDRTKQLTYIVYPAVAAFLFILILIVAFSGSSQPASIPTDPILAQEPISEPIPDQQPTESVIQKPVKPIVESTPIDTPTDASTDTPTTITSEPLASTVETTIETPKPKKIEIPAVIIESGYLQAKKDKYILAPWEIKIKKILVQKGDQVKKDQPLLQLDLSSLKKVQDIAQYQIKMYKEDYERCLSQISQTEIACKKVEELYKNGLESKANRDRIADAHEQAKSLLPALKTKLELAQLECEQVQARVHQDTINATEDCIVTDIICNENDFLQSNATLFQTVKKEDLVLRIELPSAYQEVISRKQRIFVFFQEKFERKSSYRAIVDKISINEPAYKMIVEIQLYDYNKKMLPSEKMYARFLTKKNS